MRAYPEGVTELMSSAWNAPSAAPAPARRLWRDWVLLAALAAAATAEGVFRTDLSRPVLATLALLAVLPTVLWRRTRPLAMLATTLAVTVPLDVLLDGSTPYTGIFVMVLIYALFRWGSGREIIIGSALLLAGSALSFIRTVTLENLVGGLALLLTVALFGIVLRYRAGSRHRQLERLRLLEREQLARDLHDTVAHHVSAIVIRAQAGLAMAERNPAAAGEALGVIEAEAARTLGELRSMLRVLRQDDPARLAPSPRLGDIQRLAGTRPGGIAVSVQVTGDGGAIPGPVAAAVFRLAQESVTNALRHARQATRVEVRVEADQAGVRLSVRDNGAAVDAQAPGFGIIGMMERAVLLGGSCSCGPAPGGGWVVTAVLPRTGWMP